MLTSIKYGNLNQYPLESFQLCGKINERNFEDKKLLIQFFFYFRPNKLNKIPQLPSSIFSQHSVVNVTYSIACANEKNQPALFSLRMKMISSV